MSLFKVQCNFKNLCDNYNPQNSVLCDDCTRNDNCSKPRDKFKEKTYKFNFPTFTQKDSTNPCLKCSNHPNNGGGGNCNCTIPYSINPIT